MLEPAANLPPVGERRRLTGQEQRGAHDGLPQFREQQMRHRIRGVWQDRAHGKSFCCLAVKARVHSQVPDAFLRRGPNSSARRAKPAIFVVERGKSAG